MRIDEQVMGSNSVGASAARATVLPPYITTLSVLDTFADKYRQDYVGGHDERDLQPRFHAYSPRYRLFTLSII